MFLLKQDARKSKSLAHFWILETGKQCYVSLCCCELSDWLHVVRIYYSYVSVSHVHLDHRASNQFSSALRPMQSILDECLSLEWRTWSFYVIVRLCLIDSFYRFRFSLQISSVRSHIQFTSPPSLSLSLIDCIVLFSTHQSIHRLINPMHQ